MNATTDKTRMTSSDYFRILMERNPNISKGYIKNYGELCRRQGIVEANVDNQRAVENLEMHIEVCRIDIANAVAFGYDKA